MGMEYLNGKYGNGNIGNGIAEWKHGNGNTRIETADLCRCTAGGCWDSMCTRRFGVVTKISGRGKRDSFE